MDHRFAYNQVDQVSGEVCINSLNTGDKHSHGHTYVSLPRAVTIPKPTHSLQLLCNMTCGYATQRVIIQVSTTDTHFTNIHTN